MKLLALAAILSALPALGADVAWGPAIGTAAPGFNLPDQTGQTHTLQSLTGEGGAIVVFYRSADW